MTRLLPLANPPTARIHSGTRKERGPAVSTPGRTVAFPESAFLNPDLTRSDLAVLGVILMTVRDAPLGECDLTNAEIANLIKISPSGIRRSLLTLELLGYTLRGAKAGRHGDIRVITLPDQHEGGGE